MADTGLNVGLACFSGAYLLANMANLYWLVSQQRARVRAETQKEAKQDHFYDEYQKVIDLTYLTYLIPEDAKLALSDDKFKTPISERILEVLSQTDRPDYQKVFLARKTHKASYDDLRMIEASLKDKNLPHVMTKRRNPVRSKGYTHEDVKRHILARNSSAFVRQ